MPIIKTSGNRAVVINDQNGRDAANLYAKQVAHRIGKHDALLGQQLAAQSSKVDHESR